MLILLKKSGSSLLAQIVKTPRNTTAIIAVFITLICLPGFKQGAGSINEKTDKYFGREIQKVKNKLHALQKLCTDKAPLKSLRQQFISCRLAYKKLAVLSEYFNIYETKFLNGSALNRAEDGTPDIIISPKGFQAIEELLYGEQKPGYYQKINTLATEMLAVFQKMETEPDRIHKFRAELVWDALRSATIRLGILGITGFDSPIAQKSIVEARATIEGVKNIVLLFKGELDSKLPNAVTSLLSLLTKADKYLLQHNNFNSFDRLAFITSYISPLYKQLVITRAAAGIAVPEGRSPVNYLAESIFQEDFFDINFFSPGSEYRTTDKRIALGKKLFGDPILSGGKNRSCASCHIPEKAFADGLTVPYALDNKTPLTRNTPTLWYSALQTRQFFDTRADILENQLKEVVHNTDEMNGSLKKSAEEVKTIPEYVLLFKDAYPEERESINAFNIANAISSYVRSLVALRSDFDEFMKGNKSKLTASEKNGFNLFAGKAKCATCHFIPLFNGLVPPEFTDTETEVLGVPATKSKTDPKLDSDPGKYAISNSVIHRYAFKTPTLRNIELTGPYMHNGVFTTLEEVMDFYNNGGGAGLNIAPENQTLPGEKLNLTKKEIADIIAFMKALTDPTVNSYK